MGERTLFLICYNPQYTRAMNNKHDTGNFRWKKVEARYAENLCGYTVCFNVG